MVTTVVARYISIKTISMAHFRFENLEIWKEAIRIAHELFKIANKLEEKKLWRFADQVRGVGMGIPNNISESTGTTMQGEQRQLLRFAKRECYEAANILVILQKETLIEERLKMVLFEDLDVLSRRIQTYSDTL